MPKVGKKKFPYTNKGVAAAKKYAKENDLPIIWTEDAKSGMAVPTVSVDKTLSELIDMPLSDSV